MTERPPRPAPVQEARDARQRMVKLSIGSDAIGFPTLLQGRGRASEAIWVPEPQYIELITRLNDLAKDYRAAHERHLQHIREGALALLRRYARP